MVKSTIDLMNLIWVIPAKGIHGSQPVRADVRRRGQPPGQGKRRQPVRAGVRRRGQPPGQGKRRPPARARAEELLNNHMPPAIPSDPPQALPGGGFFGKPLHSFARFRQQNAQTPPSPRVG